jgi:hypothetical protein
LTLSIVRSVEVSPLKYIYSGCKKKFWAVPSCKQGWIFQNGCTNTWNSLHHFAPMFCVRNSRGTSNGSVVWHGKICGVSKTSHMSWKHLHRNITTEHFKEFSHFWMAREGWEESSGSSSSWTMRQDWRNVAMSSVVHRKHLQYIKLTWCCVYL